MLQGENDGVSRWYAVRAMPRHEKRVRERLEAHRIECFLPMTKSMRRWNNGTRREVEVPLFPTYLFVKTMPDSRLAVLKTQGVRCFVGGADVCWSIPDDEIETLRFGLSVAKCEPHPGLVCGDRVRIARGPFSGLQGVVIRNAGNLRVVVTVSVIMQGVSVDLDSKDVEPLPGALNSTSENN